MREFETHRCAAKPRRFSLRRYAEPGRLRHEGWVLARERWDEDSWGSYLERVTYSEREAILYCPWCGERLPRGEA